MKVASDYLDEIKNRIVEHESPLKIILFGSYARGDATWDSDFDLLVVLPKIENRREDGIRIRGLLCDLPVSKDIFVTTTQEISQNKNRLGTFLMPALKEGKVIYERSAR